MTIDITPEAVERMARWHLAGNENFSALTCATLRALSAALSASQAETAAAYAVAEHVLSKWAVNLRDMNFPDTAPIVEQCAAMIRALTPADSKAVLDRMIADARADGMREAARIVWNSDNDIARWKPGFLQDRILTAIPKGTPHE